MTATPLAVVAAGCAAGAVALARPVRTPVVVVRPRDRSRAVLLLAAIVAIGTALLLPGRSTVLVLVGVGAGLGGLRLVRARRADRAAERTASLALETCERLAADLLAGQPPSSALDRAAADWPALDPVAEAHRVGADVPAAWRTASARPGAGDLAVVAAAWEVAHRTGHGLADALDRVAQGLRADRTTRRVVAGELASARATARLVAVLPLAALAMGSGAGGDPWGFLLDTPAGLVCLAGGLALGLAGLAWIEALARRVLAP